MRKFMSGAFSQREDLAIEKMIYELAKQSKKIFKAQHDFVVKKLNLKTKTLQMRLVNANNTIARLTTVLKSSSNPGASDLLKTINISQATGKKKASKIHEIKPAKVQPGFDHIM